ncbi:MAG: DegV family protein [Lactobacillales bacterium]|jgi:DegV family protein with EDD domain|nr:DegV family protein [Lactobacillales bacterium]
MKNVKIVTDSSVTIEPRLLEELDITVVPLSVMIDGIIYSDDQLSGEEFMNLMENSETMPKTSQPPIGLFVDKYEELASDGSEILSIHITHILSGTAEAARQASNLAKAEVTVIDSGFIDQSLAFEVIKAAQMAKEGKSMNEIVAEVNRVKENSRLFIGISSLDNLVKGGRIGRATGLISNILNIKAVMELTINEGLISVAKGRGTKTFSKWFTELKDQLLKTPNIRAIGISHADGLEIAEKFRKELQNLFPDMSIPVLHTGSVVATHTGKGAFAIMYYTD